MYVTKYRITKPGKDGVDWDDFLLALPEKDQLASTNKDIPLFVKYLNLVCGAEGRGEDFKQFAKRAKDGLQVESDVYITTDELLAVMWKNGYADKVGNAPPCSTHFLGTTHLPAVHISLQYTSPLQYTSRHAVHISLAVHISPQHTFPGTHLPALSPRN